MLVGALVCASTAALAEDDESQVRFGGRFSTAMQLGLSGCSSAESCRFLNFRNANVLGLTVDAAPSKTVELKAGVAVRNINIAEIETFDDTGDIAKVQPVDIRPLESKIVLYDLFGAEGLDLTAGYVRVAWGTADGVSPTDIVNAYDLEDGSGFDARLPTMAVGLGYTVSRFRFDAWMLPLFEPAILPVDNIDVTALGDTANVFDLRDLSSDAPPEIRQVETPTTTPENDASNIAVAARARWESPVGDFSLMFYRGHESLPQAHGDARLTGFQTSNRVDLGVPLVYPTLMMAGADWRGELGGDFSGWVDVGVFFPGEAALSVSRSQLEALVTLGRIDAVPSPLPRQVTQDDAPYVKVAAGADVLLDDTVYLNLQYAYGSALERQRADLHHYALLAMRISLLDGRLELEARGVLEATASGSLGFQAGGAISWLHGDAARLSLSTTFLDGESGTTLRKLDRMSHLRLSVDTRF